MARSRRGPGGGSSRVKAQEYKTGESQSPAGIWSPSPADVLRGSSMQRSEPGKLAAHVRVPNTVPVFDLRPRPGGHDCHFLPASLPGTAARVSMRAPLGY